MKKLIIIMLMGIILLIPFDIHAYDNGYQYGLPTYQLDQPIKELDNYTLRQVFTNRNLARPNLTTAIDLGNGDYQLKNDYELILNYNIYTGIYTINGASNGSYGNQLFTIYENLTVPPYTISLYSLSGNVIPNGSYPRFRFNTNTSYSDFRIAQFNSSYSTIYYEENITGLYIHTTQNGGFDNYQFKLQIEKGSQATLYQIPTYGPYNDIDVSRFNLTKEQLDDYFNLYQLAVKYELDNKEAVKDPGQYKHIFMSIYEGLTNLMRSMGSVWRFLTTPFVDTTLSDMDNLFSIDWSWDIFDVLRQWITNMAVWILQLNAVLIGTLFLILGIPIKVSILSLVFSDLVFVILGWIMIKSFII